MDTNQQTIAHTLGQGRTRPRIGFHKPDWTFNDNTLVVLKWLAVLSMLVDHINLFLLYSHGIKQVELFTFGRLAAPIFCVLVGYNLARPGSRDERLARARRMMGWLLLFATVSLPLDLYAYPASVARSPNILFNFFFSALVIYLVIRVETSSLPLWVRVIAGAGVFALFIVLAGFFEYGYSAAGTVLCTYMASRSAQKGDIFTPWLWLALLVSNIYSFALYNVTFAALYALIPLAIGLCFNFPPVPRGGRLMFYAFYPAHIFVLALLSGNLNL